MRTVKGLEGYINRYRLFWLLVVALFGFGVYYFLFIRPRDPADMRVGPDEVRSPVAEDSGGSSKPQAAEQTGPVKVDVSQARLTVSSSDGALQMRVWADQAAKNGQVYAIQEGALQFVLANRDTLLVRVTDASLKLDSKLVKVQGAILGQLVDSGQYFAAARLMWSLDEKYLTVEDVTYIGPSVQVHGQKMRIDLLRGAVDFEGPVEAGV